MARTAAEGVAALVALALVDWTTKGINGDKLEAN
jgi:hypothetical protein